LKGKSIANVTNIRPLCWIEEGGYCVLEGAHFEGCSCEKPGEIRERSSWDTILEADPDSYDD